MLCAEAAIGGVSTLSGVPLGQLARDPILKRLLEAVASEAAAIFQAAGEALQARPQAVAAKICRNSPNQTHPWLRSLRRFRRTGADAVFRPLLGTARRTGCPAPMLAVIAATLRRLERSR